MQRSTADQSGRFGVLPLAVGMMGVLLIAGCLLSVFGGLAGNAPSTYCSLNPSESALAVLEQGLEGTVIVGDFSIFPLGVSCTYESPGGLVVDEPVGWTATIGIIGGAGLTLGGIVLALAQSAAVRRER